uniref:Copper transport protein n=1 Tax=Plectus sambesii TaxID=2011161 RepID=A0A914XFV5_9BILA
MMQNRKQNYRDIMRYLYTALNALQLLLGYLLMLIFMTFNVWLCSAVIIGDAIGYFIFFGGPTANQEEEDSHITCN